jgi:hypothetical protein
MEREIWPVLSQMIFDLARSRRRGARFSHSIALIVRVYFWAVIHDRSVHWACQPGNWDRDKKPKNLPSQSTLSRRLRTDAFTEFTEALTKRVAGSEHVGLIKAIDAKALTISENTRDPDTPKPGRAVKGFARGYKLYAIWGVKPMPLAYDVQPINVSEVTVAKTLIPQLNDEGYLLGDAIYDCNKLYQLAFAQGHQLVAPRKRPDSELGHRSHCPQRLNNIDRLKRPFGQKLLDERDDIEREFSGLTCFGGGLTCLPPWVRRLHRVRAWVTAKLIINALRIRRLNA